MGRGEDSEIRPANLFPDSRSQGAPGRRLDDTTPWLATLSVSSPLPIPLSDAARTKMMSHPERYVPVGGTDHRSQQITPRR